MSYLLLDKNLLTSIREHMILRSQSSSLDIATLENQEALVHVGRALDLIGIELARKARLPSSELPLSPAEAASMSGFDSRAARAAGRDITAPMVDTGPVEE